MSYSNLLIMPITGQPCDVDGNHLPEGSPPPAIKCTQDDFYLYESHADFEPANFLFHKEQMSSKKISKLMEVWVMYQQDRGGELPPYFQVQKISMT